MAQSQEYKMTESQSPKAKRLTARVTFLLVCIAWGGVVLGGWYYYKHINNAIFYEEARISICHTVDCAIQNFFEDADKNNGVIFQQLVSLKNYRIENVSFDIDLLVDSPISVEPQYALYQYNRIKNELNNKNVHYEEKKEQSIKIIKYEENQDGRLFRATYLFDFSRDVFVDCLNYDNYVNKHCGFNIASCQYNIFIRANIWPDDLSKYLQIIKFFDVFSAQLESLLVAKYGAKGRCGHV